MPRIARIVAVGMPHHITQRGNYHQRVFINDNDRRQYLTWIQEYSFKYGVSLIAYCLMENHVHFIAVPDKNDSLSKAFNTAHMRYSQYFNKNLKQRGHLWQGRFYSCVLNEAHLLLAARYIERNPVRVGIVKKAWLWPWSSAAVHTNKRSNDLIELGDLFAFTGLSFDSWEKYIGVDDEAEFLQHIRKHTSTGHPLE